MNSKHLCSNLLRHFYKYFIYINLVNRYNNIIRLVPYNMLVLFLFNK